MSLEERFWTLVDTSGQCWEWRGTKDSKGYGVMKLADKMLKAHRLSWEIHNGPIPQGNGYHGTVIRHGCDNPGCVNPSHLFAGSHSDNVKDRGERGRTARQYGERHGMAKLTTSQVVNIRLDSRKHADIAAEYGVSRTHIQAIKAGNRWRHM